MPVPQEWVVAMTAENVIPIWKAQLQRRAGPTGEMKLVPCLENVVLILSHDADYEGCFARNELSGETELRKKPPAVPGLLVPRLGPIDDYVLSYTRAALSTRQDIRVGAELGASGIEAAARQCCYNPLRDYLRSLRWDGVQRLGTWLARYLGAAQSPYTENVGRWWLISAIARAFRPGCQADHVLILEGPQGAGKSSAIGILGGAWYLGKLPPLRDYDKAAHALAGAWMVELGEMDAFRGAASSQIKDFLTQSEDRYRPPYARYPVKQRRTCVFVGTTNDAHYLRDATGARRFWPVATGTIDRDALTRDRDALLAEAVIAFDDGAEWWPSVGDAGLTEALTEQQEERHEGDDWVAKIAEWVEGLNVIGAPFGAGQLGDQRDGLTSGEVLKGALGVTEKDWQRDAQTRVGIALRQIGWSPKQQREHGVRVRRYWRK